MELADRLIQRNDGRLKLFRSDQKLDIDLAPGDTVTDDIDVSFGQRGRRFREQARLIHIGTQ